MKKAALLLLVLLFVAAVQATASEPEYPALSQWQSADSVSSLIAAATGKRPFLFTSQADPQAMRDRIDSDPLLRQVATYVLAVADHLLQVEPVKREMEGRRMLRTSRRCLKRILYLTTAYNLTGNNEYAARATDEMLAAAQFPDWNPSHFLDVAEMTAALAIGYDSLHQQMTAAARKAIRSAIIDNGLKPSLQDAWWVDTENNWNQVCHGGLVLGALAVLDDEHELSAQIIERALKNVPIAMTEYAPDGAYPEGPGYWIYGTTYNVLLIAALEYALGTDFGLAQSEGFLESAEYYLQATGPTGLLFNYSDGGARTGITPVMYWFAKKRDDRSLLWQERQRLEQFLAKKPGVANDSHGMLPLLLIWGGSLEDIPVPTARHWHADGVTPVAMHRSDWQDKAAIYVGVKGGSPASNHAHMDIGSFVVDALGTRWAEDLGYQSYHSLESQGIDLWGKEQDAQRWTVFRLNNLSHNTLVVDGNKQRVDGNAEIISFSANAPRPHTIIDMSSVYRGQLATAQRGVTLTNKQAVLVQDELATQDRPTTVRWGMVTRAEVQIKGDHSATLQRDGQLLELQVIAPANAKLQLFDTATPPSKIDAPNQGTRMIGFTVEVPSSTKERLVVMLSPDETDHQSGKIEALADW